MDAKHQVSKLRSAAQLDVDAVGAYDAAIHGVADDLIRDRLAEFRGDHLRHIADLNLVIHDLGGETVDAKADLRGAVMKGMTAMSSLMGTEATLLAMMGNEEVTNHAYDAVLSLSWSDDIRKLLERNREDERRHLNLIRSAAREHSPLHFEVQEEARA